MRLRDLPSSSLEDRRALKPTKGDVVRYNGNSYVVLEVGNRWAKAYERVSGNENFPEMIPLSLITKTGERVD